MKFQDVQAAENFCKQYEYCYPRFEAFLQNSCYDKQAELKAYNEIYDAAKNFIKEANNEISKSTSG